MKLSLTDLVEKMRAQSIGYFAALEYLEAALAQQAQPVCEHEWPEPHKACMWIDGKPEYYECPGPQQAQPECENCLTEQCCARHSTGCKELGCENCQAQPPGVELNLRPKTQAEFDATLTAQQAQPRCGCGNECREDELIRCDDPTCPRAWCCPACPGPALAQQVQPKSEIPTPTPRLDRIVEGVVLSDSPPSRAQQAQPEDPPENIYHELMVANGEIERLSLENATLRSKITQQTQPRLLDLGVYEKYLDDQGMLTDTMADELIMEIRRLRGALWAQPARLEGMT